MLSVFLVITCFTSAIHAAPLLEANCGEMGDCVTISYNCTEPCGCNNLYYYAKSTNECLLNLEYLKELMVEKYNTEEKLRNNAENVFKGIFVAVYIFIFCASLCVLSACVYCCHVNYSDRTLDKDVKALSKKLHRDGKIKKPEKKQTQAMAESCNVVVEDAGVFVC